MDEVVEIATAPVESSTPETEQTHVTIAEQSAPAEPTAAPVPDETTLAGKTVDSLNIYQRASVTVIDILTTNGAHYFVKVSHNQADVGGTAEWGTGVLQG